MATAPSTEEIGMKRIIPLFAGALAICIIAAMAQSADVDAHCSSQYGDTATSRGRDCDRDRPRR